MKRKQKSKKDGKVNKPWAYSLMVEQRTFNP